MPRKLWFVFAAAGVLAIGVAACGGGTTTAAAGAGGDSRARSPSTARAPCSRSPRRPPSSSTRTTRTSTSPSAPPGPAAASRSSAPARPTSRTPRGRSSREEVAACKKGGVSYYDFQVANDGIAVVTNPSLKINCLTTDQLKKLWEQRRRPTTASSERRRHRRSAPGREAEPVRAGHRLGHVRLLHRRDQR